MKQEGRQKEGMLSDVCDGSSSLRCHCTQCILCKQEVAEGDRDAEDNEQRKEKEGEEKTASGKQDEKEKKIEKERKAVIIKSLAQSYCSGYSAELRGMYNSSRTITFLSNPDKFYNMSENETVSSKLQR